LASAHWYDSVVAGTSSTETGFAPIKE